MSSGSWWILAISGGYLALCLLLGMLASRRASDTTTGYVAGDRALGLVVMYFITGATIFSAFAFLGAPGWAYGRGVAVLYVLGFGCLGFVPFYFLGPRAARVGQRYGFVTQAEMVAHRFQRPSLAALMAVMSVVAFVPYLALQMKGAGLVVELVTEQAVPAAWGSALVYGIVTLYVWKSGVLGVGWTNTFQGLFMLALAWGLGLYLPGRLYGGVQAMFERIESSRPELLVPPGLAGDGGPWTWGAYSSAVLVSVVGFSAWPHVFMKAFSAASVRTIRRTVVLYPTFQIFLLPLIFIGFAGVLFESRPEQPDHILPYMLMHMDLPPLLVGLFCAGALAASMSSGDAMVHAAASIAVRDGYVVPTRRALAPRTERRAIRALVLPVMVAAYVVSVVTSRSLVDLLLAAYGVIVQFLPVLVVTLYVRRMDGRAVFTALLAGGATTLGLVIWPQARPWALHAGLCGLAVNVMILGVARCLHGARDQGQGKQEEFLTVAAGDGPAVARDRT